MICCFCLATGVLETFTELIVTKEGVTSDIGVVTCINHLSFLILIKSIILHNGNYRELLGEVIANDFDMKRRYINSSVGKRILLLVCS